MCASSYASIDHDPVRQYPGTYEGPFIVYAENQTDFIDSMAVTKNIRLGFGESFLKSVQMDQRQLKIFMYDRQSANELAGSDICGPAVRLYIPSKLIEIMGVVYINPDISSDDLPRLRSYEKSYVSECSGPRILSCRRLGKIAESWKVLITFEGQKLPSHVDLDQCLFPVSRYYAPVPICSNCLQYGHNGEQCDNRRRCDKCSLAHDSQEEYDSCVKLLCLHCGGGHSALDKKCEIHARKLREEEIKQRKEFDTNLEEWCCFAKQAGKEVGFICSKRNTDYDSDFCESFEPVVPRSKSHDDFLGDRTCLSPYSHSPVQLNSLDYNLDQPHDVFISYRRIDGSQLASLIKISLEKRGYSVFLDVDGLNAGEIRSNIKQSIKHAKYFLLILTKTALKACIGDDKNKDWVHREIVIALSANCQIIPILIDGFVWPTADQLPADMRKICKYNGVKWVHEYQEACVERLDRFMSGNSTNFSPVSSKLRLDTNRSSPARSAAPSSTSRRVIRRRSKSYSDLTAHQQVHRYVNRFPSQEDYLSDSNAPQAKIETSSKIMRSLRKKVKRLNLKK